MLKIDLLKTKGTELNLRLYLGSILMKYIRKNKTDKVYVKTNTVALGVRGTEFISLIDPLSKNTFFGVHEGKVVIAHLKSKDYEFVASGQTLVISKGKLSRPTNFKWIKEINWNFRNNSSSTISRKILKRIQKNLNIRRRKLFNRKPKKGLKIKLKEFFDHIIHSKIKKIQHKGNKTYRKFKKNSFIKNNNSRFHKKQIERFVNARKNNIPNIELVKEKISRGQSKIKKDHILTGGKATKIETKLKQHLQRRDIKTHTQLENIRKKKRNKKRNKGNKKIKIFEPKSRKNNKR